MSIVGGVDIHRKQLTFDYVERETGGWERGRVVSRFDRGNGTERFLSGLLPGFEKEAYVFSGTAYAKGREIGKPGDRVG